MKTNSQFVAASTLAPERPVDERDRLEVAVTVARGHLALELHLDVLGGVDALDEVLRHGLLQRVGAHEHRDPPGVAGDVQRRLPAELAAPTTYTSSPSQARASLAVAP